MRKYIVTFTAAVVVWAEDEESAPRKLRQEIDLGRAGLEVAMLDVRDDAEECGGEFSMISEHNEGIS